MKRTSNELKQEVAHQLQSVNQSDLLELVTQLISNSIENTEEAFIFLEQKGYFNSKKSNSTYEKRYRQILSELIELIDDFNTYGGGGEEEENEVYGCFEVLADLFMDNKIPKTYLKECIDLLMPQYLINNSGLEDTIMDWLFDIVEEEEDWQRMIDYLVSSNSSYNQSLVMKIQRDKLHDDESYEKARAASLIYGKDYYEYALFLIKKGQEEKAFDIIKEGIEKGKGRTGELYDYLFEHYNKQKNREAALSLLQQQFQKDPSYTLYQKIVSYASAAQRPSLKEELYEQIGSRSEGYIKAEIDFHEKRYEKVLLYVTDSLHINKWNYPSQYDKVLIPLYPQEMISFYKKYVTFYISEKQRTYYRKAAQYTKKIKKIYLEILQDKQSWEQYITSLLQLYPNLPALRDELQLVL